MTGLKKQRNKNHWTFSRALSAQWKVIHIWLIEDESSAFFGKYQVYSGAASEIIDTFEEATKLVQRAAAYRNL